MSRRQPYRGRSSRFRPRWMRLQRSCRSEHRFVVIIVLASAEAEQKSCCCNKADNTHECRSFLEKPAKMLPHPDPAAAEQPVLRRSLFVAVIVCDSSVLSFGKRNPLILINDYSEHSRNQSISEAAKTEALLLTLKNCRKLHINSAAGKRCAESIHSAVYYTAFSPVCQ